MPNTPKRLSTDAVTRWRRKDTWTLYEMAFLLCGYEPPADMRAQRETPDEVREAAENMGRARLAGHLRTIGPEDDNGRKYMLRQRDVIAWAANTYPEILRPAAPAAQNSHTDPLPTVTLPTGTRVVLALHIQIGLEMGRNHVNHRSLRGMESRNDPSNVHCRIFAAPRLKTYGARTCALSFARSSERDESTQVLRLWTYDPAMRAQLMKLKAGDVVTAAGALVARLCVPVGGSEQRPVIDLRVVSLEAESSAAPAWPRNRRDWGTVVQFPTSPKPAAYTGANPRKLLPH